MMIAPGNYHIDGKRFRCKVVSVSIKTDTDNSELERKLEQIPYRVHFIVFAGQFGVYAEYQAICSEEI